MTLAAMIADQADHFANKVAIYHQDQKINYGDLNLTANRIANSLRKRGVKKGENIAILLPNRPEFVQSFFGIVKAGAVAVLINTSLKTEEIEFILRDSKCTRLITSERHYPTLAEVRNKLPDLIDIFILGDEIPKETTSYDELLFGDENEPLISIEREDPAGIIYTAGISGHPKGAVLTNGNYFSNINAIVNSAGMSHRTRMMCFLPLFHVMGLTFNMLSPLYAGGSIVLMRGFSAREFLPALSKYRVTSFAAVPTVFAILNELPDKEKYDLSSLELCISGAAPLDIQTVKKFETEYNAKIIEGYGLTEATCAVCINPVDGRRKVGSVGLPLPGMEVQIVDEENYEIDPMETGQIIIRGDSVMKGYFNDEQSTNASFHDGWLYTGDLGCVDEDGYFFITGRKKEMIIRGGENIYPAEVEEILTANEKIAAVAVIGIPDPIWGEEVVAYVVKKEGEKLDAQEVIDFTKKRLADYKCPRKVRFINEMPKGISGKIRKMLLFKMSLKEEMD